jgi:bifunctional ADP-heptose synthase (sugar kinase/adenylyltransferase)
MAFVRALLEEITAASPEKVVWVDSRIRVEHFQRMILKPNEREANAASIALFGVVDYQLLPTHANCKLLFVTKAPGGVVVVEDGAQMLVPACLEERPFEVGGAGDSFSAGTALALAITGSATEAAHFGNLVASITIRERGTAVASAEEVLAAAHEHAGD